MSHLTTLQAKRAKGISNIYLNFRAKNQDFKKVQKANFFYKN